MKAVVDQDTCIGCGLCAATCPNVFHIADDGLAKAIDSDISSDDTGSAEEARNGCPVDAIDIN